MNYEEEIIELKQRIERLESLLKVANMPSKDLGTNIARAGTNITRAGVNIARDKTKYIFNGKIYPKNRLVLAVIKDYVGRNNPTFEQLSQAFDKSLQGSLNVVELIEVASKITDSAKRYFLGGDDVINLKDGKNVVVCTQWGIFNINKFISVAKHLNFEIQSI